MSRKKSKNQGDREAEEVVEVVSEKSSDDDSNDDDDGNELVSKAKDHRKPKVFQSKTKLEIVTWLVENPDILRLANEMLEMNKPNESPITSSSSSSTSKIIGVSTKSI